jgi:hypothetical protein
MLALVPGFEACAVGMDVCPEMCFSSWFENVKPADYMYPGYVPGLGWIGCRENPSITTT